jgi:hypothetical protein
MSHNFAATLEFLLGTDLALGLERNAIGAGHQGFGR